METEQAEFEAAEGKPGNDKPAKDTVIINATPHDWDEKQITFEDLVRLAFDGQPPAGPDVVITVTYSKGEHGKSGSLLPGGSVKVKNRMVFDVIATDRS